MLVTLEQASEHLRRDGSDDDADLTLKIHAASGAVLNHLKGANHFEPELDSNGKPVLDGDGKPVYTTQVMYAVQAAVLLMVGYLYKDRDNDKNHEYEAGYLPRPVTALLASLRSPALA
jgi:hypothetical protein